MVEVTGVFGNLGIDPFYAFLILLILQVALLVVLVLVYDKYKHLEKVFNTFMKGKNGKSLEELFFCSSAAFCANMYRLSPFHC